MERLNFQNLPEQVTLTVSLMNMKLLQLRKQKQSDRLIEKRSMKKGQKREPNVTKKSQWARSVVVN